jgi:CRISPR system Cascade subunit CasC
LEKDGGVRTRRLIELIATEAAGEGNQSKERDREAIRKVFETGGIGLKDENTSDILFFLPQSAIKEMGKAVALSYGDLDRKFAEIMGKFVQTPDIALCGRMTEFDAKGPFGGLKGQFTVEAALSTAHAFSTHAAFNEVDYFTAADDVPGADAGAAHVNEALFNSACFYKHFVIDYDQLKKNLADDADLASKTVSCFLKAAVKANPSGKQHAFAAFNPPEGVLVEIKNQSATPISYANAFADPVPEKSERGLIGEGIARLGQYAHDLIEGYDIPADRFWFSPGKRHLLNWVDKTEESEKEQSVVGSSNEFGHFSEFVNAVMNKVGGAQMVVEAVK